MKKRLNQYGWWGISFGIVILLSTTFAVSKDKPVPLSMEILEREFPNYLLCEEQRKAQTYGVVTWEQTGNAYEHCRQLFGGITEEESLEWITWFALAFKNGQSSLFGKHPEYEISYIRQEIATSEYLIRRMKQDPYLFSKFFGENKAPMTDEHVQKMLYQKLQVKKDHLTELLVRHPHLVVQLPSVRVVTKEQAVSVFLPLELAWWEMRVGEGKSLSTFLQRAPRGWATWKETLYDYLNGVRKKQQAIFTREQVNLSQFREHVRGRMKGISRILTQEEQVYLSASPSSQKRLTELQAGNNERSVGLAPADLAGLGMVIGRVTEDGKPIGGAEVILREEEGKIIGVRETDLNGRFVFLNLHPGRYSVGGSYMVNRIPGGDTIAILQYGGKSFFIWKDEETLTIELQATRHPVGGKDAKVVPSCNAAPYQKGCEDSLEGFIKFCKNNPDGRGCENLKKD
jgi:hypothetical protein